jgi:CRP-like cAMP-binding protein
MATINLRKLPALRDYTNSELRLLATVAPAREFAVGQALCKEGTAGHSCFLLATGQVQVRRHFPEGEKTLATLSSGQVVGQMALVDRSPRSASVVASQATVALELTRDVFEQLLRSHSPLALRFQEQIAVAGIRQLRLATQRLSTVLGVQSAKQQAKQPPKPVERDVLTSMQAALEEWHMSMDDLDKVQVTVPAGLANPGEAHARQLR